jgi:hypothetical protein
MTYADEDIIAVDLHQHNAELEDGNLMAVAVNRAERIVNGELGLIKSIVQGDVDSEKWDVLVQAATLYAEATIMDSLYTTADKRNPVAEAYEKSAKAILKPYKPKK